MSVTIYTRQVAAPDQGLYRVARLISRTIQLVWQRQSSHFGGATRARWCYRQRLAKGGRGRRSSQSTSSLLARPRVSGRMSSSTYWYELQRAHEQHESNGNLRFRRHTVAPVDVSPNGYRWSERHLDSSVQSVLTRRSCLH